MFDITSLAVPANAVSVANAPLANAGPAAPVATTAGGNVGSGAYTIQAGDTLSGIAAKNNTTVAALQALNPTITDPNKISAGATLNLKALGSTDGSGPSPLAPSIVSTLSKNAGPLPTPTTPIPATGLSGAGSLDLNSILSRAVGGSTTSSDIAGLLAALAAPSSSTSKVDQLGTQIGTLENSEGNEGTDLTSALSDAGVPQTQSQVNDLGVQAAQLKGSIEKFDAETQAGLQGFSAQPVTTGSAENEAATYQKNRAITSAAMSANLAATTALITAYNGNIDSATKLATQSVDLKYQGIASQVTALKDQLTAAKDDLSEEDSKTASVVSDVLDLAKNNITTQANNEKEIATIAVQAAANGAPLNVVRAIQNSADPAAAAIAAGDYTKGSAAGSTGAGAGAGGGTVFSQTQVNKGAANAGVDLATFNGYDQTTQNTFINGDISGAKTALSNAAKGSSTTDPATLDQLSDSIKAKNYPQPVQDYLINYATSLYPKAAPSTTPGWLKAIGNFLNPS